LRPYPELSPETLYRAYAVLLRVSYARRHPGELEPVEGGPSSMVPENCTVAYERLSPSWQVAALGGSDVVPQQDLDWFVDHIRHCQTCHDRVLAIQLAPELVETISAVDTPTVGVDSAVATVSPTTPAFREECHAVSNGLSDYLDGTLRGGDRDRFVTHVRACETCHQMVLTMEMVFSMTGRGEIVTPSPQMHGSCRVEH